MKATIGELFLAAAFEREIDEKDQRIKDLEAEVKALKTEIESLKAQYPIPHRVST